MRRLRKRLIKESFRYVSAFLTPTAWCGPCRESWWRAAAVACIAALSTAVVPIACADDQLRIGDVCRLKGQEENLLQGLGIVVGLDGTGDDGSKPTLRALARMVQLMGGSVTTDLQGVPQIEDFEDSKNTALVLVTAKIPPAGAQQGDRLNCTVSAVGAKSLQGGTLMIAYMLGPRADVDRILALASGPVSLPDPDTPTTGVIYGGCKMETTVQNQFAINDRITLVLDPDLASFSTTVDIADTINQLNQAGVGSGDSDSLIMAEAVDQVHVVVTIPKHYRSSPVKFVSLIEQLPLTNLKKPKRVVLNQKEGVIIIGENVLINPVAIAHKNFSIEARPGGTFVGVDTDSPNTPRPKLKNLVDALNALKVPTEDVIAIIRSLHRNGDLYGELIIE
ncbi:MAG: flagellar P-ring protein FlgI [Pirellulaceae bacterium]|nr:MAG: flagellar P-ring protein FlgI [Pirellulaceae bacterium]